MFIFVGLESKQVEQTLRTYHQRTVKRCHPVRSCEIDLGATAVDQEAEHCHLAVKGRRMHSRPHLVHESTEEFIDLGTFVEQLCGRIQVVVLDSGGKKRGHPLKESRMGGGRRGFAHSN